MPDSLVTDDIALRALTVFVGKTKPHPENIRLLVRDMRAALEVVEGDMVSAEREDCAMSEWKPIQTCPQDGSWFLAIVPHCTPPAVVRPIGPGSDCFENFWGDSDGFSGFGAPTHWMPPPAPPSGT